MDERNKRLMPLFFAVIALTGLALGLSDSVFSNYFKDAYAVDGFQRGLIEFPRESPGVLSVLILSALAFLGDIRLAIIAQTLSIIGLVVLGFVTPPFGVMLIFLFINSLGMHMFLTLGDSLGLSLAQKGQFGTTMGRLNGLRTALNMVAGILVFVGFKSGFFSFTTPIKLIFLIAALILAVVLCLLVAMLRTGGSDSAPKKKINLVFRREYGIFYMLAILFGARKQIMYVYAPWVLIELMGFKADTMAILAIVGAAVGVFFIPAVGRWIDKYGTARIMAVEAAVFFLIYIAYGVLSAGLSTGRLAATGVCVAAAFAINMLDRMTAQFGMVRSVYMRSIALNPEDVTPTLSLGMALDHVLSILSAVLCGWLWKAAGPQYVFVFAAALAIGNMLVARLIRQRLAVDTHK